MKKVRKLIPVSLYDIPGLEGWLEEQACQGLFPEHLGSWAAFNREGKPGTRFRLDAFGPIGTGLEPTPEQLELYRRAGWEYAFPIGRAYFLFYTADPAAPELYTDWESRGQSLDRLARQVRRAKRGRLVAPLFLVLLLLWAFLMQGQYDIQPDYLVRLPLVLLYCLNPFLLLFLALSIFMGVIQFRDCRTLLNTHQNLKNGLPPPPSPIPHRRIFRENLAILVLSPLVLLAGAGYWLLDRPVPLEDFSRPYVALQNLERREPVATWEALYGEALSHWSEDENQVEREWSLLAPVWYSVSQRGYSTLEGDYKGYSPDPQEGKYCYSPSLSAAYFHLTVPALARPVALAQLDQFRLVNLVWTYEEADRPGLDFVILAHAEGGPWQMAAVARGGRLAVFRYAGQEKLADHLEELAATVGA